MRILLTGAKGQIGQSFKQQKPEDWEMIAADSHTLDITDERAVGNMVKNFEPDVIINAAGYVNLEAAEQNPEAVFAVNARGSCTLARAAAQAGIRFLHVSSDFVFDGTQRTPYSETDAPNPLSTYAKSKLAGELLALAENPDSTIIRSSWVFSEYGNNIVPELVRRAYRDERIEMPTDKIGCPTYAGDLAHLIIQLAQDRQMPRGIFHYCGNTAVNRYEFAQLVLQQLNAIKPIRAQLVASPVPSYEITPRPSHSILSCEKIRDLGYELSDWQTALKRILPFIE